MVNEAICALVDYALEKGLVAPQDAVWAANSLLETLGLGDGFRPAAPCPGGLPELLDALTADAAARGLIDGSPAARDRLGAALMGRLTPPPREIIARFRALYRESPRKATDWFYGLCMDCDYISRARTARDLRWKTETPYGALDITINLSKPEKDPRDIAKARALADAYPQCALCRENEGFPGGPGRAARQNLRVIPLTLDGAPWFFQYSPYVYYNEHCIVLNSVHTSMKIDEGCFRRLLDFVGQFPEYFLGSNADLPVVGGSILAHDHFQGGRYEFPMARAPVETPVSFPGFGDVTAGIVRWPMSVVRLDGPDPARLAALAGRILAAWRGWTDEAAVIFAETDGVPHNTATPIARRRGEGYELDLVLRSNLTTKKHPLGLYHPHEELHHIKKENIGLIEVMGLAVLPSRLKTELAAVKDALLRGGDLRADPRTAPHAAWAEALAAENSLTARNADEVLRRGVGLVFAKVLEQAGVYARTPAGKTAFLRFLGSVG